ncbi:hypothetical protein ES319_D02G088900v1 [Gossypium barbadense]|uniref:BTB domain-containing protein n=2 Tax=Gossypium TaxID=3633 RepID=A0A5J5SA44_GOSBA|nr:hypothetical protein ES319_D02G088900v1 [Gossypium barbadense]TYG78860.1 hypothetical protein ES288_D02G094900v1 [Gossypium darwinii]
MRRHRYHRAARSESETESEIDTETMRCISCKEMHAARDTGHARSSSLDHAHRGASTSPGSLFPDVVLVNRSPVFKAMLENETEESRSGTIKISEVSYNALRAFVNYLYTAEAWLDEQRACDLVLAEKYQVKYLKGFYKKFLVSKLNWDNSLMTYVFAHQHSAKLVLDTAEEYMELVKKDPRLVMEIYEAYLSKQVNTTFLKDTSIKS